MAALNNRTDLEQFRAAVKAELSSLFPFLSLHWMAGAKVFRLQNRLPEGCL